MDKIIKGFSKLKKSQKIEWVTKNFCKHPKKSIKLLKLYWNNETDIQKLHDEFTENTLSNFYMPLGVAPNFLINGKKYTIPMVIEESSVVAAAAKSANFWLDRGGFKTTVLSTEKIGHIHFTYSGKNHNLFVFFNENLKHILYGSAAEITKNMKQRGGGIKDIKLINKTDTESDYYQIEVTFETVDSMGANFINSCLEQISKTFIEEFKKSRIQGDLQIIMSILSNYTPNCIVRAEVKCKINELSDSKEICPKEFAHKFEKAVKIAQIEPYRATTHNKGIFNGIDAVVIATGNDFRAVEACGHAYACKDGKYKSLTHVNIENETFHFWIELPISIGTVGGLTNLHPMVKFCLEILGNPNAKELMGIIAVAGLAQNFAALRSLITTGIQKGHMKMHLLNILNQIDATEEDKKFFVEYFKDKIVTHYEVVSEFEKRKLQRKNIN